MNYLYILSFMLFSGFMLGMAVDLFVTSEGKVMFIPLAFVFMGFGFFAAIAYCAMVESV